MSSTSKSAPYLRISATTVKEWFQYKCERKLVRSSRRTGHRNAVGARNISSNEEDARDIWAREGDAFEIQTLRDLMDAGKSVAMPEHQAHQCAPRQGLRYNGQCYESAQQSGSDKFTDDETIEIFRAINEGTATFDYLHQLEIGADANLVFGNDIYPLDHLELANTYPDLIEIAKEGENCLLKIIDLKAVGVSKVFHRSQVAYYSLVLQRILDAHGFSNLKVASVGSIWVVGQDGRPKPEDFTLAPYQRSVKTLFQSRLRDLSEEVAKAPIDEPYELNEPEKVLFHLSYKCEACKFFNGEPKNKWKSPCSRSYLNEDGEPKDAGKTDISILYGLDLTGRKALLEPIGEKAPIKNLDGNFASLQKSHHRNHLTIDALKRRSDVLRREWDQLHQRAKAYRDKESFRIPNKVTFEMPAEVSDRIFMVLDVDPFFSDLVTLGVRIEAQDKQPEVLTFTLDRNCDNPLEAEREVLTTCFESILKQLNNIDSNNQMLSSDRKLQFFVYERSEQQNLLSRFAEHLKTETQSSTETRSTGFYDALKLIFQMLPPPNLQRDDNYAAFHHFPLTVVKDVVDSLYAFPIAVSWHLRTVSQDLHRLWGTSDQKAYSVDDGSLEGLGRSASENFSFENLFSSQLNMNILRGFRNPEEVYDIQGRVEGEKREVLRKAICNDLEARLDALSAIVEGIIEENKQLEDSDKFLRLAKEPFRIFEIPDDVLRGNQSLQTMYHQYRYERAYRELKCLTRMTDSYEMKVFRGEMVGPLKVSHNNDKKREITFRPDGRFRSLFRDGSDDIENRDHEWILFKGNEGTTRTPDKFLDPSKWKEHEVRWRYADFGKNYAVTISQKQQDGPFSNENWQGQWYLEKVAIDKNRDRLTEYLDKLARAESPSAKWVKQFFSSPSECTLSQDETPWEDAYQALQDAQIDASKLPLPSGELWQEDAHNQVRLILGPPGTGKTFQQAWLVVSMLLVAAQKGQPCRVLLTGFTKASIANLLRELTYFIDGLAEQNKLPDALKHLLKSEIGDSESEPRFIRPGVRYLGRAPTDLGIPTIGEDKRVSKKWEKLRRNHPYLVIGATCWAMQNWVEHKSGQALTLSGSDGLCAPVFDLVCLDEASQMTLGQGLLSLSTLKPDGLITVSGDHLQLAPVGALAAPPSIEATDEEPSLTGSLYDFLRTSHAPQRALYVTYRLNDVLAAFARDHVYAQELTDNPYQAAKHIQSSTLELSEAKSNELKQISRGKGWLYAALAPEAPLVIITHNAEFSGLWNPLELEVVDQLVSNFWSLYPSDSAEEFWKDRLAVVSPHRAQNERIRERLRPRPWGQSPMVETVDKIQGQGRDIIVAAYSVSSLDMLQRDYEANFIYGLERLNVSLTRSKKKMVLILSENLLKAPPIEHLIESMEKLHRLVYDPYMTPSEGERPRHGTASIFENGGAEPILFSVPDQGELHRRAELTTRIMPFSGDGLERLREVVSEQVTIQLSEIQKAILQAIEKGDEEGGFSSNIEQPDQFDTLCELTGQVDSRSQVVDALIELHNDGYLTLYFDHRANSFDTTKNKSGWGIDSFQYRPTRDDDAPFDADTWTPVCWDPKPRVELAGRRSSELNLPSTSMRYETLRAGYRWLRKFEDSARTIDDRLFPDLESSHIHPKDSSELNDGTGQLYQDIFADQLKELHDGPGPHPSSDAFKDLIRGAIDKSFVEEPAPGDRKKSWYHFYYGRDKKRSIKVLRKDNFDEELDNFVRKIRDQDLSDVFWCEHGPYRDADLKSGLQWVKSNRDGTYDLRKRDESYIKPIDEDALTEPELVFETLNRIEEYESKQINMGFLNGHLTMDRIRACTGNLAFTSEMSLEVCLEELVRRYYLMRFEADDEVVYRSRFAEGARLVRFVKQRFATDDSGQAPYLVRGLQTLVKNRAKAKRDTPLEDALKFGELTASPQKGLEAFETMLRRAWGENILLRGFQAKSLKEIAGHWLAPKDDRHFVITAGTGSGKTEAAVFPIILGALSDLAEGIQGTRALLMYPRVKLAQNQAQRLCSYLSKAPEIAGARLSLGVQTGAVLPTFPPRGGNWAYEKSDQRLRNYTLADWRKLEDDDGVDRYEFPLFPCPIETCGAQLEIQPRISLKPKDQGCRLSDLDILRCPTCGWKFDAWVGTKDALETHAPSLFLITADSLHQWLSKSEKYGKLWGDTPDTTPPRAFLADEIHLMTGNHGAHQAFVMRRLLQRLQTNDRAQNPIAIGMSATLSEPIDFWSNVVGVEPKTMSLLSPEAKDFVPDPKGREYYYFIQPEIASRGRDVIAPASTTIQSLMTLSHNLRRRGPEQGGFRSVVFFDSIPNLKRIHRDFRDAEEMKLEGRGLASLRINPQNNEVTPCCLCPQTCDKFRDAECWYLAGRDEFQVAASEKEYTHEGYQRGKPLKVCESPVYSGNSSSGKRALDRSDYIFTTSSLEVGYDDPAISLVYQHYAPLNLASFIQRKGRGGRKAEARPTTGITLSSFSPRDSWFFRFPELLIDEDTVTKPLNLGNVFVRRGQALAALFDFLSREASRNCEENAFDCETIKGLDAFVCNRAEDIRAYVLGVLSHEYRLEEVDRRLEELLGDGVDSDESGGPQSWAMRFWDAAKDSHDGTLHSDKKKPILEVLLKSHPWVPKALHEAASETVMVEVDGQKQEFPIQQVFSELAPGNINMRWAKPAWVPPVQPTNLKLEDGPWFSNALENYTRLDEVTSGDISKRLGQLVPELSNLQESVSVLRPTKIELVYAGYFQRSRFQSNWLVNKDEGWQKRNQNAKPEERRFAISDKCSGHLLEKTLILERGTTKSQTLELGLKGFAEKAQVFLGDAHSQDTGLRVAHVVWGAEIRLKYQKPHLNIPPEEDVCWVKKFTGDGHRPLLYGYTTAPEGVALSIANSTLDELWNQWKPSEGERRNLIAKYVLDECLTVIAHDDIRAAVPNIYSLEKFGVLLATFVASGIDQDIQAQALNDEKIRDWDWRLFTEEVLKRNGYFQSAMTSLREEEGMEGYLNDIGANGDGSQKDILLDCEWFETLLDNDGDSAFKLLGESDGFQNYWKRTLVNSVAIRVRDVVAIQTGSDTRQLRLVVENESPCSDEDSDWTILIAETGSLGDGTIRSFVGVNPQNLQPNLSALAVFKTFGCPNAEMDRCLDDAMKKIDRKDAPPPPGLQKQVEERLRFFKEATSALPGESATATRMSYWDLYYEGWHFRRHLEGEEGRQLEPSLLAHKFWQHLGASRDDAFPLDAWRTLKEAYEKEVMGLMLAEDAKPPRVDDWISDVVHRLIAPQCFDGCEACVGARSNLFSPSRTRHGSGVSRRLLELMLSTL